MPILRRLRPLMSHISSVPHPEHSNEDFHGPIETHPSNKQLLQCFKRLKRMFQDLLVLPPLKRVTDDVLAMARPSTELINRINLIEKFKSLSEALIWLTSQTVIVAQATRVDASPRARASYLTGRGLGRTWRNLVRVDNISLTKYSISHKTKTFNCEQKTRELFDTTTYVALTKRGVEERKCIGVARRGEQVYYYNFKWKDYGFANTNFILDIVKVISFALTQGKIAIHCHAGRKHRSESGVGKERAMIRSDTDSKLISTLDTTGQKNVKNVGKQINKALQGIRKS
uniref:Uncharacterized protein n=1 Tax=Timema poppense TaxID=170557 RepID=A0A7R9CWJ0_TIMPO|nr:unnamed protein product [Timema poppensis]